jgi:hypothetical protein
MVRCLFTASAHAPALSPALHLRRAPFSFHVSLSFQSFRHRTVLASCLRSLADCNIVCLRIRGKLIVLVFLIFLNCLSKPLSVFSPPVPTLDEAFGERDSEAFHDTIRAAEPLNHC